MLFSRPGTCSETAGSAKTCRKMAFQAQIRGMYPQIPSILMLKFKDLQKPVVNLHSKVEFEECILKFHQFCAQIRESAKTGRKTALERQI